VSDETGEPLGDELETAGEGEDHQDEKHDI
jgi:hypothetical protein